MMKCAHDFYPHTSLFMLTWTKDADLVVVNAEGPDLASLYAWWLHRPLTGSAWESRQRPHLEIDDI